MTAEPTSSSGRRIAAPPRSWELEYGARPLPMNAYRRLHFRARANYDREWRSTFAILARAARIPRGLAAVRVDVAQTCRRPPLPDVAGSYPTAKAAIDGLVDAGVIADDDPTHLRAITFLAPVRGPADVFVLIVHETTEGARP